MKRPIVVVIPALFVLFSFSFTQRGMSAETQSRVVTLKNGIFAVVERRTDVPLVHMVVAVRAGSKYEPASQLGISHLIEHLILFGRSRPESETFVSRLRSRGGFLNGHTDSDLVTIELTFPRDELDFAVDLMGKIVFNRRFHQVDLDRERSVVQKEKSEAADNPERRGLFLMLESLFAGHPYSRSAFGNQQDLQQITLEDLHRHYQGLFLPGRSGVALVGDLDLHASVASLEKHLGKLATAPPADSAAAETPALQPLKQTVDIKRNMDVQRAHIWIGFRAPAYNHHHRVAMRVLSQMLGRGGYPLLSTRLSGRFQLVDAVSMNYLALEEEGCAWIHMVLESDNVKRARNEVDRFLKAFRAMNFSTRDLPPSRRRGVFDFMETAMNQLRLRSETGGEDGLQRALSYARFVLLNQRRRPKSLAAQLADLSPSRLRSVAADYLLKRPHVVITFLPEKTE